MSLITFNPAEFTSQFYFEQLSARTTYLTDLSEAGVSLAEINDSATHRLLIAADGLNLGKINAVFTALTGKLKVHEFYASRFNQVCQTQAVIVNVTITDELDNQILDALSQQLAVELMLTGQAPGIDQPGLLLMDMDSTMIACECIDEIAKLTGAAESVAKVTEQAMQGKLDFAQSLYQRVACLEGVDVTLLKSIRDRLPIMPGLSVLIRELKQAGWKVAVASGGFTFFADYLKQRFELDSATANVLEQQDGKLTGKVLGQVVDAKVKAQTLKTLAKDFGIDESQTIAMGDGANDLVMMQAAGLGVACHAKPIVRQQADVAIRSSNLDTLLHLLG
ncbi:phosphoserine phosphatase SerB [Neptunicella marina]